MASDILGFLESSCDERPDGKKKFKGRYEICVIFFDFLQAIDYHFLKSFVEEKKCDCVELKEFEKH